MFTRLGSIVLIAAVLPACAGAPRAQVFPELPRYIEAGKTVEITDVNGETRTFDGPGKVGGYAVLNVNAEMGLGAGWQAFARINNLFDRRYASGGALAENPFVGGSVQANSDHWRRESFVAPGAPRAAWVGVRYSFGGR